jgi:Mg-chelatase subunit ChlD
MNDRESLVRWRLVLGSDAEQGLGCGLNGDDAARDRALGYLYNREYRPGRNVRGAAPQGGQGGSQDNEGRTAGLGESQLTVPEWINQVHELFPQRVIERLERDALERYNIAELVTNPELLARAQPSQTLLKAVLQTKHLMNQEVLNIARQLVRKVIEQLLEKLARAVRQVFLGARDRRTRSQLRVAKNFDARTTIRRNLANYSPGEEKLYIRTPYFFSRQRRQADRWQVIVVVDESGSMLDSVIYAAVTAAIFVGIPSLKTHLVLFDTNIVDVTEHAGDPVEAVMKVQLGGGTDIANAMSYAAGLVENPRHTIVVLITDFFEGGNPDHLLGITKSLIESGVTILGLAALDNRANPYYDRDLAERMAELGAHVGAMTPGELAEWVAKKVR